MTPVDGQIMGIRALVLIAAGCLIAFENANSWAAVGQPPATASAPSSASAQGVNLTELPEVTVTGHRASLKRRVSKFVNRVAGLENGEGLPRWKVPVCPLVTGVFPEDGGVILKHLSAIARAAKVPFGVDDCYPPNLFIVETDDPEGLLEGWNNHSPTRMEVFGGSGQDPFTGAPQSVINEFIETPRTVRVWYYTRGEDAAGVYIVAQSSPYTPPVTHHAEASRILSNNVTYDFARVFVIADQTRLRGVTIAQLADYVSMVALAKLKPGVRLGDVPSILKLFDGPPQTAPSGVTDWDQAFLKSLYATEQRSRLQRGQIVSAMVRQIAH